MDFANMDGVTFWMLVVYVLLKDIAVPLTNKLVPAKAQQKAALEARETAALEKISDALNSSAKAIVLNTERLDNIERSQTNISITLQEQTKALSILVDRETRKTTRRKGA